MADSKDNLFAEQYINKLVAFIDILGFKKMILDDVEAAGERIRYLEHILECSVKAISDKSDGAFSVKMFSDCICLSSYYSYNYLMKFLHDLAYIQFFLCFEGVFIRGGLTSGLHYESDKIIYSQGLVEAYEYEQLSVYPRIIIDNKLVDFIKRNNNAEHISYIMQSSEGKYFLDYLDFLITVNQKEVKVDYYEYLIWHKDSIILQVNRNFTEAKVLDKYLWVAQYHNNKTDEIIELLGKSNYDTRRIEKEAYIDIDEVFQRFIKA